MKPASRQGYVYFIKPRRRAGPIKIGFSVAPVIRIQPIQANSPLKLEIIGYTRGSTDDERFLHRCFADHFSHAEWFHFSAELKTSIEGILEKGIQHAYETLTEKGLDRLWCRQKRSREARRRLSEGMRRSWASKRERFPEMFRKRSA